MNRVLSFVITFIILGCGADFALWGMFHKIEYEPETGILLARFYCALFSLGVFFVCTYIVVRYFNMGRIFLSIGYIRHLGAAFICFGLVATIGGINSFYENALNLVGFVMVLVGIALLGHGLGLCRTTPDREPNTTFEAVAEGSTRTKARDSSALNTDNEVTNSRRIKRTGVIVRDSFTLTRSE